ncbi:MAG: hypothetical protein ABI640_01210 [Gammaproteobacteria bacterium]
MDTTKPIGSIAALVLAATAATYGFAARAQAGYEVSRSQTVTNAPAGYVGRKTTDREMRVGNTPETDGNSLTFVMTVGGFVRKCPTAQGVATGSFEYSMTADAVDTDDGETKRTHYVNRLIATLEGHVRDDSMVDHIDLEGDFTRERDGAPREQQHVRTTFTLGEGGALDIAGMLRSVEITSDLTVAAAIALVSPIYLDAVLVWTKPHECVDFSFDPPSATRTLGPNGSVKVRTELRTKEGNEPVGGAKFQAGALVAIGHLEPREGQIAEDAPLVFTYTASSTPKKGDGFDIATYSRAGATDAIWKIVEPELRVTLDLELEQDGAETDTGIHLVLPETKLIAEEDGAYRGAGVMTSTGHFNATGCSADMNFTSALRVTARPEDAERKRFLLELIPNEAQHTTTMKCPDVDLALPVPLPVATWLRGPTTTPVVLGQPTPVNAVTVEQGLTSAVTGTLTISVPPPQ